MLEALIAKALHNRLGALLFAVGVAVLGWFAFRQLTIEAFPDPSDTQVQVITLFSGQPSEEVERKISLPLERALNGTPHLTRLRSISLFGLSYVTLTFDDEVSMAEARPIVLERLRGAELPAGVETVLGPLATPIGEIYRYTLAGAGKDPLSLRTTQDWTVRPALLRVPGVADVISLGGMVREIHVEPDPSKMASYGVQLDDVFRALQKASDNASGGFIERGAESFVIRSLGTFRDIQDVAMTRVTEFKGVPVHMRDIAAVTEGYAPRQSFVSRDGQDDVVEGIVLMRKGENPSAVLDALRDRLNELRQRGLPSGVEIQPFYDRSELVDTTLHTVFHNLLEGALLVVLVLFAFTLSLRASLIVATVIPLSLAASFIYLRSRGMSANLLSMGAVDFGIIVDGAVILVEHLFHVIPKSNANNPTPLPKRIEDAARQVARPTLFSLLIIIAAYLPIFSLQRVEGRIFSPMANTVVSALIGAMVMSFTLVPVLAMFALRKGTKERESPLLKLAQRSYEPTLRWALARPATVLVLAVGVFASSMVLAPRLGSEFLPELNEGALYAQISLPRNLSVTECRKLIPQMKELLRRTPEVRSILTQLGRPEDGTDPKLPNHLEAFIQLKPLDEWRKGHQRVDALVEEMSQSLSAIPGIEFNFSQPIRDNVADNISGQPGQIALKIYGDDVNELERLGQEAKGLIASVPGASEVALVRAGNVPQVAVELDRTSLARFGLDVSDLQDEVETAMAGHVASEIWEGEKRFDVTVRLPRITREDLFAIRAVRIPTPDGTVVPLAALADVHLTSGRAAITREGGRRYLGVRLNVRGRDLGSFVAEARQKVNAGIRLPAGYRTEWGGEFENQERAMARLRLVVPLALILTFILLFSAFDSALDATVILLHVPLALAGGIFALGISGLTLSVSAAVGFIALLGQAVLNGVLVVAAIRARTAAGEAPFDAVWRGSIERLRAILMTALLAALGLVPAAMSHAIGSETQQPIAVVVVGGTLTAAALTLVVLPVSMLLVLRAEQWFARRSERTAVATA
ncbi:MAG TPA: CusA/CzcA family heavy metal efflux RND transporter [Polyangiaceae bacterium]|nr:CusA/CzcA family heavy metal efflux RND transporter [Polyangiaceae bacterium]